MFFYFTKNQPKTQELLLDIFQEKGVVAIIQGYQNDLEDIQDKIDYDLFLINKSRKNLNNIKSKTKEGFLTKYNNYIAREGNHSYDYHSSMRTNRSSVNYWHKRTEIYTDALVDLTRNKIICQKRSEVRLQCHECWHDISKQWGDLANDYLELSEDIRTSLYYSQGKHDEINDILTHQMRHAW